MGPLDSLLTKLSEGGPAWLVVSIVVTIAGLVIRQLDARNNECNRASLVKAETMAATAEKTASAILEMSRTIDDLTRIAQAFIAVENRLTSVEVSQKMVAVEITNEQKLASQMVLDRLSRIEGRLDDLRNKAG